MTFGKQHGCSPFWTRMVTSPVPLRLPLPISGSETTAVLVSMMSDLFWVQALTRSPDEVQAFSDGSHGSTPLEELFPGSSPSLPSPEDRIVELALANPFITYHSLKLSEHPRLTSVFDPVKIPTQVRVNGLVKFHLQFSDPNMPSSTKEVLSKYRQEYNDQMKSKVGDLPLLPADFGRGLRLNPMDLRLFKFCTSASSA